MVRLASGSRRPSRSSTAIVGIPQSSAWCDAAVRLGAYCCLEVIHMAPWQAIAHREWGTTAVWILPLVLHRELPPRRLRHHLDRWPQGLLQCAHRSPILTRRTLRGRAWRLGG